MTIRRMIAIALLIVAWDARGADTAKRFNILFVIADDHGLDAGCYGNAVIKTPALDQLAVQADAEHRAPVTVPVRVGFVRIGAMCLSNFRRN
jgi:hypothetical protein